MIIVILTDKIFTIRAGGASLAMRLIAEMQLEKQSAPAGACGVSASRARAGCLGGSDYVYMDRGDAGASLPDHPARTNK